MKVVVLGSGIIGTSSAWWLKQAGHDVTVVDRCTGPGLETSFANGGQISVAYSEPWANPQAPARVLRWMMRDDSPLLFRPQADLRQWWWGASFLRECLPARLEPNIRAMLQLAEYSRRTLREMRSQLAFSYDHVQRGILTFYRRQHEFEIAQRGASILRDLGVDRRIVSADEVVQIEPALLPRRDLIVGGDYTSDDESGDTHKFTTQLAEHAKQAGVEFVFSTQVTRLLAEGGRVYAAEVIAPDGHFTRISGDAFVVALGSYSPQVLQPLGISINVYPTKGYSATFTVLDAARAPEISLTDSSHKVVLTRLGNRLRIAGTAELSGYSRALNRVRCEALTNIVRQLLPEDVVDLNTPNYWAGLRPSTPSGVPLVGRTKIRNLFLNTGHGTLGWTMGAGSGRVIADIVSNRKPEPQFPYVGL